MFKKIRRTVVVAIVLLYTALFVSTVFAETETKKKPESDGQGSGSLVYIIPIEKEVERGLEAFLKRTTAEAVEENADHIIFEIDTPGGRVDSAKKIGKLLQSLEIETTAYVTSDALSAGSYIALNSDYIYMAPQATIGASGIITADGNAADKKARSAWISAMKSAAESKGRDPLYATAMADESISLPEYGAGKGQFLTLEAKSAKEVGYSEGTAKHRTALLTNLNLGNATITEVEPTAAEELARFLTNPIVVPILLSVASLGFVVELYSPGFGIAGTMSLVSLVLLFYGHIVAGLAGMEAIVLLVVGILLIILEFFVPGGIVGSIGVASVVASLLTSGYSFKGMVYSVGIAFIVAIAAAIILYRFIGLERGLFGRIILRDQTTTELGYISQDNRSELLGQIGRTATQLRPSGTAVFGNERVDVISEGMFVEKDEDVEVIRVEGVRVVVRPI